MYLQSSNLSSADYDSDSAILTISFHSGSVYEYYHVPYAIYRGLLNASSHGTYFHANIRNHYSYRRIC